MASPSLSPSKGKPKETTHWRTGWWDFYPLVERPKRPLQWSNSSVIFTAHPTQPRLTARHFSSSKQFSIPSPSLVASDPTAYEPPTLISVAPRDDYLFAYFPGRDADGAGCIWQRGSQLDTWNVRESWSCPRGGGVVAATWLASPREWSVDSSGAATRLPHRGPLAHVANPALLLVLQDCQVHICYFRLYIPNLKIIKTSISSPRIAVEGQPSPLDAPPSGPSGTRVCTDATIALGYNDSSILIAMHSRRIPPTPAPRTIPGFDAMNLDTPVDLPQSTSDNTSPAWETWGEESSIDLCEIQLLFDGTFMGLAVNPLPPLQQSRTGLTELIFISTPPLRPSPLEALRSPSLHKRYDIDKGKTYLAVSYLDFDDYTSIPKSELILYSITRLVPAGKIENTRPKWVFHQEATRLFSPGVLSFIAPFVSDTNKPLIHAGVLDTSGTLPKGNPKAKETPIGTVKVLNLNDLSDSEDWEYSTIQSPVEKAGQEFPIRAVLSPNRALICTISSALLPAGMSIQPLPKPHKRNASTEFPPLSVALACASLGRRNPSDITHLLVAPSSSLSEMVDLLYHTLRILDRHDNGLTHCWTWDILGIAVEVYKTLAKRPHDDEEQKALTKRWESAHDMCSLAACNMVFEDCKDGEGYDRDAIWQLTGLCTWMVGFVERLMKECVLFCDAMEPQPGVSLHPLDSPILLHLVHPYSLQHLFAAVRHLKRYRAFIGSLPARTENAQIARDALIDLIDRCGVDVKALDALLEELVREPRTLEPEELHRALASCRPTPGMRSQLSKIMKKVSQSSILDKSTLFIKPDDLVDGVARLTVDTQKKEKTKDVIMKEPLVNRASALLCLRCGGNSEVNVQLMSSAAGSPRWRNWVKVWTLRCICGGPWLAPDVR